MTCVIKNRMSEIETVMHYIDGFANDQGVSTDLRDKIKLAAEELVVNIISYAYDDENIHTIRIELHREPDAFHLRVWDDGKPFNPIDHPGPKPNISLDETVPGGLGIHLVKNFADRVEYSRIGNTNRLTVIFKPS